MAFVIVCVMGLLAFPAYMAEIITVFAIGLSTWQVFRFQPPIVQRLANRLFSDT